MGISSAMSPKERKQIHAGLLEQGCTVVRDGKRGTLYMTPDQQRWMLPFGTSDNKARLAMRAEVRRLGLHWPLDPADNHKKEKPVTAIALAPTTTRHERVPGQVQKFIENGPLPREATYRQIEGYLRGLADKTFWTDELFARLRADGIPGYISSSGMGQAQVMLHFAGFQVVESKRNRNGYSYRWARDKNAPWPTEFAPVLRGASLQAAQRRQAMLTKPEVKTTTATLMLTQEAAASTALDGETFVVGTDEVEPEPEQAEVATITLVTADGEPAVDPEHRVLDTKDDSDDAELSLALEQERRANKAERERDGLQVALEKERREHAGTRRDLMVRLAARDSTIERQGKEIERLRLMIQENAHLVREGQEDAGVLGRAHHAEQLLQATQEELAQTADALIIEREATAALTRKLQTQERLLEGGAVQAEAQRLEPSPQGDDDWWPLEGGNQTVDQLVAGAAQFGLDVRIQARRKD